MNEPIELQRVRFVRFHGGFGANPGDCLYVARDWAQRAIASGIVEDAPETAKKSTPSA